MVETIPVQRTAVESARQLIGGNAVIVSPFDGSGDLDAGVGIVMSSLARIGRAVLPLTTYGFFAVLLIAFCSF